MKDKRWKIVRKPDKSWQPNGEYSMTCTLKELIEWLSNGQEDVCYIQTYEQVLRSFAPTYHTPTSECRELFDRNLDNDITINCYDSFECP